MQRTCVKVVRWHLGRVQDTEKNQEVVRRVQTPTITWRAEMMAVLRNRITHE